MDELQPYLDDPPPRKARGPLLVFAIINIVFGGLAFLESVCGLISLGMMGAASKLAPAVGLKPAMSLMTHPAILGMQAASLVVGSLLIVSGIMLIRLSPSAIRVTKIAAGAKILEFLVDTTLNWTVIQPAVRKLTATAPGPHQQFELVGQVLGLVFGALFGLVYPTVLLFMLGRPEVATQFAPAPPSE